MSLDRLFRNATFGVMEGWREQTHLLSLLSAVLRCSKFALFGVRSPSLVEIVLVDHPKSQIPCPAACHIIQVLKCEVNRRALAYRTWSRQSKQLEAWESGEAADDLRREYRAGGGRSPGQF